MKALNLTGGGANAAFQAKAIEYLTKKGGMDWDIYLGMSAGALNAVMAAQGDIDKLIEIWSSIDSYRWVYKKNPFGYIVYLWRYWKYNNSPLYDLIKKNVDVEKLIASGKTVKVCTTCWETGEARWFGPEHENFIDAVVASASMPFYFPMRWIGDKRYYDGGLTRALAIDDAIKLGATSVTLILASPRRIQREHAIVVTPHVMGERTIDIMINRMREIKLAEYREMEKRGDLVVIAPSRKFSSTIKFDGEKIFEAMESGWAEAQDKCLEKSL